MRIMKKNFKVLFLAVFVSVASCSFTTKEFNDPDKDKLLLDLITYVLQKGHYDPKDINDDFSAGVYKDFINGLDPLKRYFLASDIEEFSKYETEIDDQLKNKDLSFFDLVYERFNERMEDVKKIYPEVLDKPFDFTVNETINVDYDNLAYANSIKELKARWKQQLKFTTLSAYYDLVEDQKNREKGITSATDKEDEADISEVSNNPKTASTDEPFEHKSMAELEAKARETTKSSLDEYFDFTKDLERKDYFSIYLNTIVEEFDPHTNYFAPPDKDRFDLRMSGKLEGIGARLQKKNDYITIIEIISGGPAWRSEKVEVGDVILKVKQEDEKDAVSIVGMRIDDAVKLIKGPKGTKVTLTIKNVDGTITDKVITRDVVELEETYAKSSLIDKGDRKFGLINLPQFYFDMENYKERNAATDVKKEILRLKEQGMEGLVLDLRDNGGGSLRTAVDIAGLFIKKGPVVQVASNGNKEVLEDKDSEIVWDGPLVILVNELSASASEILAAAMQDYKRAIILGSKQTYGMPDRYSYIDVGERDYDNPLPYDKIDAAKYDVWEGYIDYDETIQKSKERMAQNEQLKLIDEDARWIKARRDEKEVNLNYETYSAEIEQRKQETKRFDAIDEYDNHLTFESLPYETALMKKDTTLSEKRKRWHKNLSKDMYIEEAVHVLEDLKLNNIKAGKVADIKN